jgi:hypothetical protein
MSGDRKGRTWSIANVEDFDGGALHFRLGRDGRRSLPMKSETGDFVEQNVRVAPFTDIVLDLGLEVCAIADKGELGLGPKSMGDVLATVLSKGDVAVRLNATIAASPIKEPRDFLERVRSASAIYRVWVTTNRPNPFDAEEEFVKPTAAVVEAIGAEQAKTTFSGKSIDGSRDVVQEIIKSTAANGGDAGARLLEKGQEKASNVTMSTSLASVKAEDDANVVGRVLAALRETYARIRNRHE